MKLKKIASLMLAGIMAVSMLAGCKSGTTTDDGNTDVKPVASDAVAIMNDAQSAVKFDNDADFDAALAAAAKKATHKNVKGATYEIIAVEDDPVYKELKKKLDVDANLVAKDDDIFFNALPESADKGGRSKMLTGLWKVEANGLTEKAALEQVAAEMKGKINDVDEKYPDTVTLTGPNAGTYEATYTGTVSIVTVNTSDSGESETAYYIAVSVTQTLARDAQTNVK